MRKQFRTECHFGFERTDEGHHATINIGPMGDEAARLFNDMFIELMRELTKRVEGSCKHYKLGVGEPEVVEAVDASCGTIDFEAEEAKHKRYKAN